MRVLHLVGSPVDDFFADLSRLYASDCLEATASERYDVTIGFVSPDGSWRFPADLDRATIAASPALDLAAAVGHLASLDLDVVVPQLFCLPGMTTYRALVDLLGLPLVGNDAATMALGAHKPRARAVVAAAGVAVPRGEVLVAGQGPTLAPPVVVKPADADNSHGVTLVRDASSYDEALAAAFAVSREVLVEEYVELGREVRCGVLERDGELVCLPLEEYAVDRDSLPIRGADDKIARRDDGDLALVAKDAAHAWIVPVEDPATEVVHELARRCHVALGCRDYSLVDVRIDPGGRAWFLEAGLYCSFARQSVVAVMAQAAGIPLTELFATAIDEAVARHHHRREPSMDTDKIEAIQNVADRVSSYQDGATERTVEQELRDGLNDIGADLSEADISKLVGAIEADAGEVRVGDVLA